MAPFALHHILDLPRGGSRRSGSTPALALGSQTRTYGDLADRAKRLARWLSIRGLGRGDRVAVLMRNNLEWFDVAFAASFAGLAWVPISYLLKTEEVEHALKDSAVRAVFFDGETRSLLESVRRSNPHAVEHFVHVGETSPSWAHSLRRLLETPPLFPDPSIGGDDLLQIQYTSGTTGVPKGVVHTHSTIAWNTFQQVADFEVTPDERWLCVPSLSWAGSLHYLTLATLWAGGLVVVRPSSKVTGESIADAISRFGITRTLLVPTILRRFVEGMERAPRFLPSLRAVFSGGETLSLDLMERFSNIASGVELVQTYGLSEFPATATIMRHASANEKTGSVGRASSTTALRVVDEDDLDVPPGTQGEVIIRSPSSMARYWNDPQATAQSLRGGWLWTGDLGVLDEDGLLSLNGRRKDLFISGGLNVSPAEVERIIQRHPLVREAAVVGVPDPEWGEVGAATVVVAPEARVTVAELVEFCRARIAHYKVPKHWHLRGQPLPRNASGKIEKGLL